MKTLSIFLFVLSICMISHVYGAGFKISNELKFKKKLWFTCYSGDNRIAPRILEPGESWDTTFNTNIWGTTRFMCTLKQGPNYRHHQSFTAFKQFSASDSGGTWDWRARENGIYLKVWDGGKHARGEINMHRKYGWIN
ncbi:hypothetical protein EUTSA_v10005109mg [Eutrema salsugineum]|uniref:S-protein homolog n=1 Tax=Eutrema salsugineum TaxID=72664 RepID=V4K5G3_EUTSA|nr:S-protein homolog 16 [Eutrema salsugineum]ESQ32800.1 hypothetical protein EUTSA_v10005109mg [Eutrema salsugineum]